MDRQEISTNILPAPTRKSIGTYISESDRSRGNFFQPGDRHSVAAVAAVVSLVANRTVSATIVLVTTQSLRGKGKKISTVHVKSQNSRASQMDTFLCHARRQFSYTTTPSQFLYVWWGWTTSVRVDSLRESGVQISVRILSQPRKFWTSKKNLKLSGDDPLSVWSFSMRTLTCYRQQLAFLSTNDPPQEERN